MDYRSVWIGFDPREAAAFAVAKSSLERHSTAPFPVRGLVLNDLRARGLYTRETQRTFTAEGHPVLYDVISEHTMATEFAISRFLVPHLAKQMFGGRESAGWALFMDCDMLVRRNIFPLFAAAKSQYAVMVVKHNFNPPAGTKMDGQVQSQYARKNWSSVMLFNCDHPANAALTPELVNSLPGRDLHRFCWLDDSEIGELPIEDNYLVGFHNQTQCADPRIVHFTDGIPTMKGYEDCEFAEEWRIALERWAECPR